MNAPVIQNEIIRASAGTGKTYELSTRYLKLLFDGVAPDEILATTFTCKAAGEILDRVVNRLADGVLTDDALYQLAQDIGLSGLSQADLTENLRRLVSNIHLQRVQTIDAFFAQITRAFSLEIGLPPNWEIVEETQMNRLRDRAIRRVLTRKNANQMVHLLTKGQTNRSVTQLMRETVNGLYEIYQQAPESAWHALPEQTLLTEEEISQILEELERSECPTPGMTKELAKSIELIREENWDRFIEVGLGKKAAEDDPVFRKKTIPPEVFASLRRLAEDAINRILNYLVVQTRGAYLFLRDFDDEFSRLKLEYGALRFDDVNFLANTLVEAYGADGMSYRLDQNIKHVLFDEFQDTSIGQWQVVRPLATRSIKHPQNRSFFCVGDVKQAIYRWRGGVAEIFDEVEREFTGRAESRTKEKSYRSAPPVITMINSVFGNLSNHPKLDDYLPAVKRWQDRFKPHSTWREDCSGYACVEKADPSMDFMAWSAARIKQLFDETGDESIAVLTRTNDEVARLIYELGQLDVPASEEGGNPLTDSAAVNLVLSALRLIDHPEDSVSQLHVAASPLATLFDGDPTDPFTHWMDDSRDAQQQRNQRFRRAANDLRLQLHNQGFGQLIASWADRLDKHCTRREWFRLGQLVEMGFRVGMTDMMRPAEFVAWVQETPVNDPSTSRLRVMTIHKAKGLEFDLVVAPCLDFGLKGQPPNYIVGRRDKTGPIELVCRYVEKLKRNWLPGSFQDAFDEHIAQEITESISLLYVTLTRAKRALHVLANPAQHADYKSVTGLVLSALGVQTRGNGDQGPGVLWQDGDPDWFKTSPTENVVPQPHAKWPSKGGKRRAPQHIELAPPRDSGRVLDWDSPSSREGDRQLPLGRLLSLEYNREQRLRGTLLHACLEKLIWLDDGTLPDADELAQNLLEIERTTPAQASRAIAEFNRIIKRPRIAALLSRDQYRQDMFQTINRIAVQNERRFTVKTGRQVLTGSIDRLVLLFSDETLIGADIIDFKTDQIQPGDAQAMIDRVEVYRPQMQGYVEAVHTIYGLAYEQITARLAFVGADHVATVA